MTETPFSLQPFLNEGLARDLAIAGRLLRDIGKLAIRFELSGPLQPLMIPPRSDRPERTDRLWEQTCFELFLHLPNDGRYWEFNLSPSGNWNVYRFDGYRRGMRPEEGFASLPFDIQTGPDAMKLLLEFDPESIVPADCAITVAVCAILKANTGGTTHWALTHPGARPDFHRPAGIPMEPGHRR